MIDSSFGLSADAFLNSQQAINFFGIFFVAIDIVANLLVTIFGLQQLEHLRQIGDRLALHLFGIFKLPVVDQLDGSSQLHVGHFFLRLQEGFLKQLGAAGIGVFFKLVQRKEFAFELLVSLCQPFLFGLDGC